jgi:hypothetical protein
MVTPPTLGSCLDDNEVALLVDGALPATDRTRIEHHLDDCAECTELVSELARSLTHDRVGPVGYRLVRPVDDATWEADDPADRRVHLSFGAACDPRLTAVRHHNVVEVFAVGEHDGEPFVAHAPSGQTFRARHAATVASPAQIVTIWRDALDGLTALHGAGIVHGRVSPDHVFCDADGRIRIGAFTRQLTRTSGYLAPELLDGAPATARSDQFGACAAIWEALTGATPFTGRTPGALAVAMQVAPRTPDQGDHRIYAALLRGLSVDPRRRWETTGALRAALASPPPGSGRAVLIAVMIAIAAAIAFALR